MYEELAKTIHDPDLKKYFEKRGTACSSHYNNNAHLQQQPPSQESTQPSEHVIYMDATSLYPSSGMLLQGFIFRVEQLAQPSSAQPQQYQYPQGHEGQCLMLTQKRLV